MQRNVMYPRPIRLPAKPPSVRPERRHALPHAMVGGIVNLTGVVVYLWLQNGRSFWFYIVDAQKDKIIGYAWMGRGWQRQDVFLKLVWSYY